MHYSTFYLLDILAVHFRASIFLSGTFPNRGNACGRRCGRALWLCLLGAALICLLPGGTVGAARPCGGEVQPWPVEEVAPGVFVRPGVQATMSGANGGAIANIGFILGTAAVAVIDTGGSACDGYRLRAAIKKRSDLPIRFVINTHVHPDHLFGNAAFAHEGAQFIGHRNLARALAARGAHYLAANRRIMGAAALEGTEIIAPTLAVEDRMELDLGGRILELVAHAPAHTDNDLTVLDRRSGTLWTGDLVFLEHLPVVDGSLKGWFEVMDELAAIPAIRAVPGHGPASVPWPQALDPQRRYLSVLARDLRRMIAQGLTMNDAIATAAASERARWRLFGEYNARNASAGFAELEWE